MKQWQVASRFVWLALAGTLPLFAASPRREAPSATEFLQAARDDDREVVQRLLARHVDVKVAQGDGFTALHWAAYNDDVSLTKVLLKAGAEPEARTRLEGDTPLFLAAANGDSLLVETLIAGGAKASTANDNGTTPLMEAAAAGRTDAILALLNHGASINAREKTYGQNALFFAASHNRYDAVRLLADHGADTTVKTNIQRLARISVNADGEEVPNAERDPKASGAGQEADGAVGSTVPRGRRSVRQEGPETSSAGNHANADSPATDVQTSKETRPGPDGTADDKTVATKKDEPDAYGFTRADRAARVYGSLTMGGLTALHVAARDGQFDAVRALLDAHADIDAQTDTDKSTPLILALINGHYDLATYLIDRGADVTLTSTDGLGPLYAVIDVQWAPHTWYPQPVTAQEKTTYIDLIKQLIAHKEDVNAKLDRKLWFCVFANDETWVDVTGATPFWRAAYAGDLEAMKLLAANGADVNAASKSNDTPLMVAAGLGWAAYWTSNAPTARLDAVKFCLEHGADPNTRDIKGYTAIHGAAFRGDNSMIEYLLAHGADLQVTSKAGDTVADSANGLFEHASVHPDTVALLEKLGSKSNNNCRSNECVVPLKADRPAAGLARTGSGPNTPAVVAERPASAPEEKK
jgi:ankyrin repeat protein